MSGTMRAAVADALRAPLVLRELDVPTPGAGQLLVRIAASGVCHTDLSMLDGDWPMKRPQLPIVPGHEASGYVAACGPGPAVAREGDAVGVFWLNSACGACADCAGGREPLCLRQTNSGYTIDGTYAEYCLVSADYAVPLPRGAVETFAPIMCAGVTAYKAVKELALPRDSWVVINGVGGAGHLAIQYARVMGLRVIAVDVDDDKVALATALGATLAINATRDFPVNRIVRHTDGGAQAVIVATGAIAAFDQAIRMLRRGGTCMLIGVPRERFAISVFDVVIKGLTVRGSLIGTRHDVREALDCVSAGLVTPVIERRPLEDVNDAVETLRQGRVRGRLTLNMM